MTPDKNSIDTFEHEDENTFDIESQLDQTVQEQTDSQADQSNQEVSKHKVPGKHSLKWDPIFKGKQNKEEEEEDSSTDLFNFQLNPATNFSENFKNQDEYIRQKSLKEEVYGVLIKKTKVNLKSNRRKPSRVDFNKYYQLLLEDLKDFNFSNAEIFVELAYYFSDNLYNMFKLLDKDHSSTIINQLMSKYKIKEIENIDFLFMDFKF